MKQVKKVEPESTPPPDGLGGVRIKAVQVAQVVADAQHLRTFRANDGWALDLMFLSGHPVIRVKKGTTELLLPLTSVVALLLEGGDQ